MNQHEFLVSPNVESKVGLSDHPIKLGVLASGSGTNFQVLAEAIAQKTLNASIEVLIYNNPDAKVKDRADHFGITSILINHRDYRTREEFDGEVIDVLQKYQVEWVIMAGWMRVVTSLFIESFPNKIINIHPSLLPSFPGIKAVEQALKSGVKITGCTVHLVTEEVDAGPIIMQAAIRVFPDDTVDSLHHRIQLQEHYIFPRAIALAIGRAII